MLGKFKFLWQSHRIAFVAFLGALLITLIFALRVTFFALYWAFPNHQNQPPERWMTPRYIAFSWGLDPSDVAFALKITADFHKRPSLNHIAEARGVPVTQIIAEVDALLETVADPGK